LQASERRLKTIFETTNEGFWLIDNKTAALDVNPMMCTILGRPREEIIGKPIFAFVDEENQQVFKMQIERRKQGATGSYEIALSHPDGTQVPCLFNATPLFDESGEKVGSFALVTDIAELKKAEIALRQAMEAAEAANRAKSLFLANMSHELRTPLNAILGFNQLLIRERDLNTQQQEYLKVIGRSGEHLLKLINDVLEMSKIEAGQTILNQEDFDLYQLLDGLEEVFQQRAQAKGLKLVFDHEPALPQYVHQDEGKLRQVLLNLLNNAVKFTEVGGVALRARYAPDSDAESGRLFFEIEDTGPGIASEEMEILFEAFVQTSTGLQSLEGTGLGLPISQQFVNLMDGEIGADSKVGRGSIFKFSVQVETAQSVPVKTLYSTRRPVGLEPGQPTYRILVVEDRWEAVGFEVREAENGQQGIQVWEEWEPQLIWMDMRMPVMDGYEATKRIKSTARGQATAVIALTASAFEEQRTLVLSAGCDEFVRKPFREEEIFAAMAKHLGVRYQYDEEDEPSRPPPSFRAALTATERAALPATWVAQVHDGASQADGQILAALIAQIEAEHGELAVVLTDMMNEFRYDEILDLIQP
jgi:PAS domain S-box-containing protein